MNNVKNKLKIFLITYNRKDYLKRTFEQIFAENSPIRDFDITVLDNASTDGSSELIQDYCVKFPNLTHIKHKINIGGNANICRAYEMSAVSNKEYVWVLCDDDMFDFSNWDAFEKEIEKKTDIICVSNYICNTPNKAVSLEYQTFQLTFVPAGIYRTELITDSVLTNMYDAILCMFPQSCITINAVNQKKNIKVLKSPIVHNGLYCDDSCQDVSFTRGYNNEFVLDRKKNTSWFLGYVNVLSLLNDKKLILECFDVVIVDNGMYSEFWIFYSYLLNLILTNNLNYFIEIFRYLKFKRKFQFFVYFFFSPLILCLDLIIYSKRKKTLFCRSRFDIYNKKIYL